MKDGNVYEIKQTKDRVTLNTAPKIRHTFKKEKRNEKPMKKNTF
jgi:hypothetical protein